MAVFTTVTESQIFGRLALRAGVSYVGPSSSFRPEVIAGPLATHSLGRYVISATAGLSAMKLRLVDSKHVGAIGTLGFGAVF